METTLTAHAQTELAIIAQLNSNAITGLTTEEAQKRLQDYGYNQLDQTPPVSLWYILFQQFISPLVWVLAVAAVLAFLFQEWLEGVAIIGVIFINAGIGFFMEKQAIKSMEALKNLAQTYANVFAPFTYADFVY